MKTRMTLIALLAMALAGSQAIGAAEAAAKAPAGTALTEEQKAAIQKEVRDQFDRLVEAIGQMQAASWSENYSKAGFASAIVNTQFFGTRAAWVDTITSYFSARERQSLEPSAVQVTALSPRLALLTGRSRGEIRLKSGETKKFAHVFTAVWRKEKDGWKILHSHESFVDEPARQHGKEATSP